MVELQERLLHDKAELCVVCVVHHEISNVDCRLSAAHV